MSDLLSGPREQPSQELLNKEQAKKDLDDITALQRLPAFQRYFLRRLAEKIEPVAYALLRQRLTPDEFTRKQAELATLEVIARMLSDDETGNRSILRD